jgi:hypothetical protein
MWTDNLSTEKIFARGQRCWNLYAVFSAVCVDDICRPLLRRRVEKARLVNLCPHSTLAIERGCRRWCFRNVNENRAYPCRQKKRWTRCEEEITFVTP